MYDELIEELRLESVNMHYGKDDCELFAKAARAIEELAGFLQEAERDRDEYRERLDKANDAIATMKPKYETVCVKCKYYNEANFNDKGFLICPACGMDITARDFCSYFEKAEVESNDS